MEVDVPSSSRSSPRVRLPNCTTPDTTNGLQKGSEGQNSVAQCGQHTKSSNPEMNKLRGGANLPRASTRNSLCAKERPLFSPRIMLRGMEVNGVRPEDEDPNPAPNALGLAELEKKPWLAPPNDLAPDEEEEPPNDEKALLADEEKRARPRFISRCCA
jgi:hypothetical protein